MLCQLSYAPGLRPECSRGDLVALSHKAVTLPYVQRRFLGILFAMLAAGLGLVAVFSALEGGSAWVIALAAGALAVWLGDLARRALMRRRA